LNAFLLDATVLLVQAYLLLLDTGHISDLNIQFGSFDNLTRWFFLAAFNS